MYTKGQKNCLSRNNNYYLIRVCIICCCYGVRSACVFDPLDPGILCGVYGVPSVFKIKCMHYLYKKGYVKKKCVYYYTMCVYYYIKTVYTILKSCFQKLSTFNIKILSTRMNIRYSAKSERDYRLPVY